MKHKGLDFSISFFFPFMVIIPSLSTRLIEKPLPLQLNLMTFTGRYGTEKSNGLDNNLFNQKETMTAVKQKRNH